MRITTTPTPDRASSTEQVRHSDELAWAKDALGGPGKGKRRRYLVRPSLADPQLFLPLAPTSVTSASLRRHHDDRSVSERLTGLAAQAVARVGRIDRAGGEITELDPFALVENLASVLGEQELIPTIGLGPRRRNRKPVVQLLRPDGVTVGFAKIGWSPFTRELVTNEGRWLREVDGRMPKGLRAPAVLHQATIQQPAGTIDVVVTAPLPTSVFAYRREPLSIETMAALARLKQAGPTPVVAMGLVSRWRSGPLADTIAIDRLVDRHGHAMVETGLWHGDLTPWNSATLGGVSSVWDWEFAGAGRPIGFDAIHLAFETVRREEKGNERKAIAAAIAAAPSILNSIQGPAVTTSPEAVIDLYLAELLDRELRLAGEGWRPEHLGPLDEQLIAVLQQRLES